MRPFLISISKAKAARLVRSLLDLFLDMEAATGQEVELCLECIDWAKAEKRTFLRQALEVTDSFFIYRRDRRNGADARQFERKGTPGVLMSPPLSYKHRHFTRGEKTNPQKFIGQIETQRIRNGFSNNAHTR